MSSGENVYNVNANLLPNGIGQHWQSKLNGNPHFVGNAVATKAPSSKLAREEQLQQIHAELAPFQRGAEPENGNLPTSSRSKLLTAAQEYQNGYLAGQVREYILFISVCASLSDDLWRHVF